MRNLLRRNRAESVPAKARSEQELRGMLANLGTWMYRFDLGYGVQTTLHNEYLDGIHNTRWQMMLPALKRAFDGRWPDIRAIDCACNEGWFAFQVARLGAKSVLGFDARDVNIRKAQLVQAQTGTENVSFQVDNVFDLSPVRHGTYELVLCLGLMYHLEDPMGALRRLRSVTSEMCVIDTEVARAGAPIEIERGPKVGVVATQEAIAVIAEPEFKWNPLNSVTGISLVPNLAALKAMLRHAGFRDVTLAEAPADGADRYVTGDRVVLVAHV